MQCNNPITLVNPKAVLPDGSDRLITVPCGKCMSCRIARTREWSVRLLHEMDYHADSVFVTLTYSEENLPEFSSLVKADVQKFFKRLRKAIPQKIKYYVTGEYGDVTFRPHYHAIIFGLGLIDKDLIEDAWNLGFITVGIVCPETLNYVAGYIQKKLYGEMASDLYMMREHPFALMSKGLGLSYVMENKERLETDLGCTVYGVPQALPRYYVKKLDVDSVALREKGFEKTQETIEFWEKRGFLEADTLVQIGKARDQADANLKGKFSLRDRDKV